MAPAINTEEVSDRPMMLGVFGGDVTKRNSKTPIRKIMPNVASNVLTPHLRRNRRPTNSAYVELKATAAPRLSGWIPS